MSDFLLELFSEEIPARMQRNAIETLSSRLREALKDMRLEHGEVKTYVTPRRLAVWIQDMPDVQPDREVERKGPKVGAPEGAVQGFCRSVGLEVSELEQRAKGKDQFYFAVMKEKGKPAKEALSEVAEEILAQFPWPKSQRWGDYKVQWVRPLRHILCLLGEEVVPVRFGHLTSSNQTFGHRFLAPDSIEVKDPAQYEGQLEKAYVIADTAKRREKIATEAAAEAARRGVAVKPDEGLLEEVTGLVEWPVCLLGDFDEDFLNLPPEVLVLEMRHHQKYFACLDEKAAIANQFLLVSNMQAEDGGAAIVHGNQRVLRARLEDGKFYWQQDKKKPLSDWQPALEKMVFHAKLGSVAEKVERIRSLATFLAIYVPHANLKRVDRVAELCKSDLVSGMVGEFPELQGVMGRYYALEQGEEAEVADAIRDHYLPAGAEDDVPEAPLSITVSLADKLDSLVGLFAAGEKPTGSKDPFALRRAALGVIRIIFAHGLRVPLLVVIDKAMAQYPTELFKDVSKEQLNQELLAFFADRLKVLLRDEGKRHDLIQAVAADGKEDDLWRLAARVQALENFLKTEDGSNLLAAYTRASNIVSKEEKADGKTYVGEVEEALLEQEEETTLWKLLAKSKESVNNALQDEDFERAMRSVAELRRPVDAFFEKVTVNAEDQEIRRNRLYLLSEIRGLLNRLADFAKVEG